jgi:16S rRNA G966 N2-methylase RsmD
VKKLHCGDNLQILREHVADESVDLIYLDPPFNSKRDYNPLFKTPKGHESDAQITAFEDSWHWGGQAQRACAIAKRGHVSLCLCYFETAASALISSRTD